MRVFIAAELPGEIIEALAETSAELRARMRGRYVATDSLHVTLAFMGDVDAAHIDAVVEALEDGCRGMAAFDVALGELGSFGRRSKATLWQGFGDAGELPSLAQSIRENLRMRGVPFDDKPFRPHVTLMRAADLSTGALPLPACALGPVSAITLFRSDLSGKRPAYEAIHTVALPRQDEGPIDTVAGI